MMLEPPSENAQNESPIDWQTVLASELISGASVALGFCFDVNKLSRNEADRDALSTAGQKLTEVRVRRSDIFPHLTYLTAHK